MIVLIAVNTHDLAKLVQQLKDIRRKYELRINYDKSKKTVDEGNTLLIKEFGV